MQRVDIINTIGRQYLTSNTENGEYSYVQAAGGEQALKAKLAERFPNQNFEGKLHKYLDIRFEDPSSGVVILIETKQHATDADQAQIETYWQEEVSVHPSSNRTICILCSTEDNYIQVWQNGKNIEQSSVLPMAHYVDLFVGLDISSIYDDTKRINEMLHSHLRINRLASRMIYTAAFLTAETLLKRINNNSEASLYNLAKDCGGDYDTIVSKVSELLHNNDATGKLAVLVQYFDTITPSIATYIDDEDTGFVICPDTVRNAMLCLTVCVRSLSNAIKSERWRGEDVMSIFFNEFNRYRGKSEQGQVFTPEHIASFMYRLADVHKTDYVGDFACGSGMFLCKAMNKMIAETPGYDSDESKDIRANHLFGIEFDKEIYAMACANMLLHKDGKSNIAHLDTRDATACDFIKRAHITKVLMNPPYENKFGCMEIVRNVLDNVESNATCAFLLPENKLEKTPGNIVSDILTRHRLTTIVKLPAETFDVGVTVSIFIFQAHTPQNHVIIDGFRIDNDGLVRVKNQGRQDLNRTWANEFEDYWVNAIRTKNDTKYNTYKQINPDERLSYPVDIVATELTRADFAKTAFAYLCFKKNIPPKALLERVANKVVYEGNVTTTDTETIIALKKG